MNGELHDQILLPMAAGDILANLHNRPVSDSSSIDHDDVNDYFFIFIHAQQSGLYRIALQGPPSK